MLTADTATGKLQKLQESSQGVNLLYVGFNNTDYTLYSHIE